MQNARVLHKVIPVLSPSANFALPPRVGTKKHLHNMTKFSFQVLDNKGVIIAFSMYSEPNRCQNKMLVILEHCIMEDDIPWIAMKLQI